MSKVLVNESSLSSIGNAIREKNGETTKYKPSEMGEAILAITTGSGGDTIPEEAFGQGHPDNSYKFYNRTWNWFMTKYADQIEPQEIAPYICCSNVLTEKFPISFIMRDYDCQYAFSGCNYITEIDITPTTEFYNYNNTEYMFSECHRLRTLPDDLFGEGKYSEYNPTQGKRHSMFRYCHSLRNIPNLDGLGTTISPNNVLYQSLAWDCYVLDTLENIPVLNATLTANRFTMIVDRCYRLKDFTFTTDNGVAKTANWKSQIIDLSTNTGWNDGNNYNITGYNSGIVGCRVDDDADYSKYKNHPDWWSNDYRYSRYNKESAVRTINSLPDTSAYLTTAGGTNTIKFLGDAGKLTDGGAINTLTDAEIAVATAKGWTVSFV